jgi:hypothetical protein
MTEDWGKAYSEMDVLVAYSDGREAKQVNHVMVCNSTGLLSIKTTGRGRIKAGYNVIVNAKESLRLGIDPEQVIVDQGPKHLMLHLGENPGGVTVAKFVPETKAASLARIAQNIEAEHGATVASYWKRYRTSDRADEAEDVHAADTLRAAGY